MGAASRRLRELAEDVKVCTACPLWRSRKEAVPGEGKPGAKIFFIGEAPGRQEDRTGRPFVGPAGRMLDAAMGQVGLRREEAFITSVVKCKPTGRKKPRREEVDVCTRLFLFNQIEAVGPKIIVPLGNYGLRALLGPSATVGRYRGKLHRWRRWPVWPTYHPAAALRNPRTKLVLVEDLRALALFLGQSSSGQRRQKAPQGTASKGKGRVSAGTRGRRRAPGR